METFPLPSKIELQPNADQKSRATIVIEPCYPGYGTTLGNALRRVLLSSLPGAALTRVKISGVDHEFSTIPHVKEDVVDILLNLKLVRVKIHESGTGTLTLSAKGEGVVKAKDLKIPSNIEVMNPDLVLATLTDSAAKLEMEITAQEGRGYVPVETQEREKNELGVITLDAIYTPVKNVNFDSENVRVGQMTNYDKLTLDIATDGSITPAEAFRRASEILVSHFALLTETKFTTEEKPTKKSRKKEKEEAKPEDPEAALTSPEEAEPKE